MSKENKTTAKSVTFKAIKLVTAPSHLMSTAITRVIENTEAKAGELLSQGTYDELKQTRVQLTQEKFDKVQEFKNDWKAKFEEAKAKRLANKDSEVIVVETEVQPS